MIAFFADPVTRRLTAAPDLLGRPQPAQQLPALVDRSGDRGLVDRSGDDARDEDQGRVATRRPGLPF